MYSPELVLFCGPPFVGKTEYYHRKYNKTHTRICPREVFQENPSSGLRSVILQAVNLLQQQLNVVIDDENQSRKGRLSFLRLVKKKVPECKFKLIKISPKHGVQQLFWTRQFRVASLVEKSLQEGEIEIYNKRTELRCQEWFDEEDETKIFFDSSDQMCKTQGWSVENVSSQLCAHIRFKLELPALFVQWESFCVEKGETTPDKLATVFKLWLKSTPCGRICVLADGAQIKTGGTTAAEEKAKLIKTLTLLTEKLQAPIHLVHLESPSVSSTFDVPPNPGILAYLHRRHYLDLTSPFNMYLYLSESHRSMAEKIGLPCCKVSKVIEKPAVITTRSSSFSYRGPAIIREMKVEIPMKTELPGDQPVMPLYEQVVQYGLCNNHVSSDIGNGWREYVFVSDLKTFQDYVNQYKEYATHIEEPESKVAKLCYSITSAVNQTTPCTPANTFGRKASHGNRQTPQWMTKESPRTLKSQGHMIDGSPKPKRNKTYSTMYVMTEAELVQTAKAILSEAEVSQRPTGNDEPDNDEPPKEDVITEGVNISCSNQTTSRPQEELKQAESQYNDPKKTDNPTEERTSPDLSVLDEIFS